VVAPAPAPAPAPAVASAPSIAPGPARRRVGPAVAAPPPPPPAPAGAIGGTAGSIGTPSTATPVGSGDAQLDRVDAINIDDIRDQRAGVGGAAGRTEHRGPAVAAQTGDTAPQEPPPPVGPNVQPAGSDPPKKEDPVYKKWWFWAVVAVSGYVVYQLVNSDSQTTTARTLPMGKAVTEPGGLTLLHW
jgi:hypothetical protein